MHFDCKEKLGENIKKKKLYLMSHSNYLFQERYLQ